MPVKQHLLKIYNSLNGSKEDFVSIDENRVGMYVCGPTVYNYVHLGNLRTFLSFDLVYRYLSHLGYKVRYVRNITDVGHLLDDEDEDKIAKRAKLEQLEPMEIVKKYTHNFHEICNKFNLSPPSIEPTATGHMIEQIEFVKGLIDKGIAYEKNGSVYFDVSKYNETEDYGELSNRNIEELLSNSRNLDSQEEKNNAQDFALWKKAAPQHIMRWPSPWGNGFPGWHLECTVMSTKYLGESFDIHGGGMDLKFPHHECEIAQAKGSFGKEPVNYWMHANMLTLNGQKMSKSTGNTILPEELFSGENDFFEKPLAPMVLRFFMLQAQYRSTLDLSNEAVVAAEKAFLRLMKSYDLLQTIEPRDKGNWKVQDWIKDCYAAMDDDFNSPVLIAQLFEASKKISSVLEGKDSISEDDLSMLKTSFHSFVFDVLGLENIQKNKNEDTEKLDGAIRLLLDMRDQARVEKKWPLSDKIRDELEKLGIKINDEKSGSSYSLD